MVSITYSYAMVELHHLRHFVGVLDSGNVSAAARNLHVSQPALTKSIHRLEELLGAPLFDRTPKPVPTRFGQLVGRHARILLAGAGDLAEAVALFCGLAGGELSVGAGPLMADALVGPAIGRLMQLHPKLRVHLHVDNYSRFPDMLRSREIDFFVADITDVAHPADLDIEPVPGQDIIWFCRPGHPLLAKKKIDRADFLGWPLAAPELPKWTMAKLHHAGREASQPNVLCSHYSTLMKIVAHSDCVSGALAPNIAAEITAGWFVQVHVAGLKLRSNPGIVALKKRAHSPAAHALMEEIRRGIQRLPSDAART